MKKDDDFECPFCGKVMSKDVPLGIKNETTSGPKPVRFCYNCTQDPRYKLKHKRTVGIHKSTS